MPWLSARVDRLVEGGVVDQTAPDAVRLAAIAALNAETIWLTIEVAEPVHWNEQPVRAQASWHP